MRSQGNPDIFLEKGLSRCPNSDQGVATELTWRSIAFLRSSCGDSMRSHDAFSALSRRSQCMHCAFMAFAMRFHDVCTALTVC